MNYLRNQINFGLVFVFLTRLFNLSYGVSWVDFGEIIDHETFYTDRFVIVNFYTTWLPWFIRSRCPTPILSPSLVLFPPCSV